MMKKKGDSEIIAILLLILIVIFIMSLLIFFVMKFLNQQEAEIEIQSELQDIDLNIDDIEFDSTDNQKMTLVLSKGQGSQILINLSEQNYSYNVTFVNVTTNITWVLNSTLINVTNSTMVNVTNSTMVNVTNSSIIMVPNSTIINGSSADIVLVSDVSGSMGWGTPVPIEESKDAAKDFIDSVLNNTGNLNDNKIGLVAYDNFIRNTTWTNFSHILSNDSNSLKNTIDRWEDLGATCICCGVLGAINYLGDSSRTKVMIVMTDGESNKLCTDFGLIGNAKDQAIQAAERAFDTYGIVVHTVGFGSHWSFDELTLQKMADAGNGSYYLAETGNLSDIYYQIQQNITWMDPVNISFNQSVHLTWSNETINETFLQEVNVSWIDNINVTWWEQINETINETVTVEIFESQEFYATLKVLFYTDSGDTYTKYVNISDLPSPLETKEIELDLSDLPITTDDVKRVAIYSVIYREGKEIISREPIALWERPSLYSIFRWFRN